MGNICRSPAGEGVLQHHVQIRDLQDQIAVDSAGTHGYHVGHPADARMRAAAKKRGYELKSLARQVTRIDLDEFDLVIAMDHENREGLLQLHQQPRAKLMMLSEFLVGDWPEEVPDPYYGGEGWLRTSSEHD